MKFFLIKVVQILHFNQIVFYNLTGEWKEPLWHSVYGYFEPFSPHQFPSVGKDECLDMLTHNLVARLFRKICFLLLEQKFKHFLVFFDAVKFNKQMAENVFLVCFHLIFFNCLNTLLKFRSVGFLLSHAFYFPKSL